MMLLALTEVVCIIWTALALPEFLKQMLVQVKAARKQQWYWKVSKFRNHTVAEEKTSGSLSPQP